MEMKRKILIGCVVAALLGIMAMFPRYDIDDDNLMYAQYQTVLSSIHSKLSVMTFNIRLDCEEYDLNNHFTKRVHRLVDTIDKWRPHVLGLQEPFGGQLLHLRTELTNRDAALGAKYQAIGFERQTPAAAQQYDMGHISRKDDFKIAILYDNDKLELLEQDYIWLSRTPRQEDSKDWGSIGLRCLNIARFKLRDETDAATASSEILVFNTHLDVWSENARREQSRVIAETIKQWQTSYPNASVLLLGDFNTAPGQAAYQNLANQDVLHDAWVSCKQASSCVSNSVANTFHGWFGSLANTYLARVGLVIGFSLYGTGVQFPRHVPRTWEEWRTIFKSLLQYPLSEAVPKLPWNRFHVDWILYKHGDQSALTPKFVAVADVRKKDYSSDHFPVVAVFDLQHH